MSIKLLNTALAIVAGLALLLSGCNATTISERQIIELQAHASHEVNNDEAVAILYTQHQANNPQQLNALIQQKLNAAFETAKKYPSVKVSSGQQNTSPIYNNKQRITGWSSHAEIIVKSTDLKAVSELLGILQDQLMLQSLQFQISPQQREQVENQLITDVTKTFQQRAVIAQRAWNASNYDLVKFKILSNTQTAQPLAYATDAAANASSEMMDMMPIQAGQSRILVEAIGSVQLN